MVNWEYGGYYSKYDMRGEISVGTGRVKVHDIHEPLPEFMKQADCLFVDPPWNIGNLKSFYTKAGLNCNNKWDSYAAFALRLLQCIDDIAPEKLYVEIGRHALSWYLLQVQTRYKHVVFYNSTYYHKKGNVCYVIYAGKTPPKLELDGQDEENIIETVCRDEKYTCIGDLCMGTGLVGYYADKHKRAFVGTELNLKRLAVLLERIKQGKLKV